MKTLFIFYLLVSNIAIGEDTLPYFRITRAGWKDLHFLELKCQKSFLPNENLWCEITLHGFSRTLSSRKVSETTVSRILNDFTRKLPNEVFNPPETSETSGKFLEADTAFFWTARYSGKAFAGAWKRARLTQPLPKHAQDQFDQIMDVEAKLLAALKRG